MAYGVHLPQVPFPYLYTAKLPSQPQNFPPLRSRTTEMTASHILNDTHRNNKPEEPNNEGVDLHVEEQQHVKGVIQKSGTGDTSNLRDYSENSDFGDDENVEID